jgi:hypothetical protein
MVSLPKKLAKVVCIGEAGRQRDGFEFIIGFEQSPRGFVKRDSANELRWSEAGLLFELVAKVASAHPESVGNFLDNDETARVLGNESLYLVHELVAPVGRVFQPLRQLFVFKEELEQ